MAVSSLALARHVVRATPWATVIAACTTGTALTVVLAHVAQASHHSLDEGTVRITFLPAVAGMAFVARAPFRAIVQAVPVPARLTSLGQILLALPVVALAGWAQVRIAAGTAPAAAAHHLPAVYPLVAQMVAWCAISMAVAACCDRTRYADVGGTVAALVTFGIIAVAWFVRVPRRHLVTPPATPDAAATAWYGVAAVAVLFLVLALGDRWHRYRRVLHLVPRSQPRSS